MAKRNAGKKKKNSQKSWNKSRILGISLIVMGVSFVTLSTAHNVLRLRSLRLDRSTVQEYLGEEIDRQGDYATASYPAHIFIKWFIDVDVEPTLYHEGNWTVSPTRASYLATSGRVGGGENIVLYGHNTRSILGNIRALRGGEEVVVTTVDGSVKPYRVESMIEVDPTDTRLVQPTDTEVLTMYTCSGFLDSKRFIVRAVPVGE